MRYQKLLAIIFFTLILIPKINIISIDGESAGIRVDDIIIILLCPLIIYFTYMSRINIQSLLPLFFFLLFTFFTTIFNIFIYSQGSMLYPLRYIEYSVFLFVGTLAARENVNIYKLILLLLFINYVVMILQFFSFFGGFSSEGYIPDSSERLIGLTGGPWEIGLLIVFSTIYIICNSSRSLEKYLILLLAMFFLLLTGSRMAILSLGIIMFFYYLQSESRSKLFSLFIWTVFISLAISAVLFIENPLKERSLDLFKKENIEAIAPLLDTKNSTDRFDGFDEFIHGKEGDTSLLMRVPKWSIALYMFTSSWKNLFFGVGHGLFGPALDGGWLRLVTEGGFIGLFLFLLAIKKLSSKKYMKFCAVALLINMLMIDVYISYKVMALFYFLAGYGYNSNSNSNSKLYSNDQIKIQL